VNKSVPVSIAAKGLGAVAALEKQRRHSEVSEAARSEDVFPARKLLPRNRVGRVEQAVPALVHQPVVVAAELDQVREVGAAALCPVPYVVGMQEPVLAAARGEAAGSVAAPQRSLERR
jgi:hypothetical protein